MALAIRRTSPAKGRLLATVMMTLALMLQPMYGVVAGQAVSAASMVSTPSSKNGWSREDGNPTYVAGPVGANGSGSLKLTTAVQSKQNYFHSAGVQVPLGEVSNLGYRLFVESGIPASYQLKVTGVERVLGNFTFQGSTNLVWEGVYNGQPNGPNGGFVDLTNLESGRWWSSQPIKGAPNKSTFKTLAALLADNPNAKVTAYGIQVGSGTPNATSYVDTISFMGDFTDFNLDPMPKVTGENFNTHSGSDYKGINVGFSINDFGTVSSVKVDLYKDATLLTTNTGNGALMALINSGATQLSTPFITESGTYTEEYWVSGAALTRDSKPTKAVVTVAGVNGTRSTELTTLTEPNGWAYESLFAVGVPMHESPANDAYINYNDFWFEWSDVEGAVSYELQNSTDPTVDANGSFQNVMWTGDYQNIQPAVSRARSVGANGTWYWQVRAIDVYGNKSKWTTPWKVTIDKDAPAAPTLSVTGLVSGDATNNSSVTATWTKPSDDTAKYEYQYWNDILGNAYKESTPWTTEVFAESRAGSFTEGEGTHYFRIRAVDHAGNVSGWSNTFAVVYDTTAPAVKVNLNRAGYVESGAVIGSVSNPEIEASDKNLDRIELWKNNKVTGSVWPAATSSRRANIKFLGEGTYVIKAYDKAGNVGEFTVTIDNTAPTATFASSNNNGNALTKGDVTVTMTTNEPIQKPADWTYVDATRFTRVYSNNGKKDVVITDIAGNVSVPQKFEVKRIDKNAPTITGVTNGAVVKGSVALVVFDPKYEGYDGFDKLHGLKVNGVEVPTMEGPGKTYLYAASAEGSYTVIATDKAGNSSEPVTFTIDNTAPVATLNKVDNPDGSVSVLGSISDANLSHYWLTISKDGVKLSLPNTNRYMYTAGLSDELLGTFSEDGEYVVKLEARDKAGNKDNNASVAELTFTISTDEESPEVETPPKETPAGGNTNTGGANDGTGGEMPITRRAPSQLGIAAQLPFASIINGDSAGNENAPSTDSNNGGEILGEQDKESGTPLEDTGEVAGAMDKRLFGLTWYWWVVLAAALVGGWLWLAAAIRRRREEEA